jgi:hypothetical protein
MYREDIIHEAMSLESTKEMRENVHCRFVEGGVVAPLDVLALDSRRLLRCILLT